jgi:glycosyltransferase involved in cell wall biosynthesis
MTSTPPFYSFVIPTRDRHDVLGPAIQTILAQTRDNFELVVMDNHSTPETRQVVDAFASPRIRYVRAPERLSMLDNWEFALDHVKGDYVHYLGDDDGMFPDSVEVATHLHREFPGLPLGWQSVHYFWPDFIVPSHRGLGQMRVGRVVEVRDSRWALTEAYSGRLHQAELPTLVFSFVPRATIEQARKKYGRYFWFRAPDVSSAIVNAINSDAYLYSYRPLGINGASRHSNGASHMYAHINDKAFKKWLAEAKIASAEEPLDGRLTGGFITEVAIVDELFWLQNKFKSEIGDIPVDMRDFLKWIVQAAPRYFARFDEVVAAVETMAKRNGVDMREIQIPAKVPPPEKQDFTFGTDHRTGTVSYSYYTNTDHVRTVADFAEEASRHCVPVGQLIIQDRRSEATTTRAPTLGARLRSLLGR